MSDILSASRLLQAIAAILFNLWYLEISKALEITPKRHKEDNVGSRQTVSGVLLSKAMPVAIMSLGIALIFLPDALKLAKESCLAFYQNGFTAFEKYDAVRTAYCFVSVLSIVLAGYMCTLVVKLWSLRKRLSK